MLPERHVETHRLAVPCLEVSMLLRLGALAKASLYERLAGRVLVIPLELRVGYFRLLRFVFRGGCGGQLSSAVHLRDIVSRPPTHLSVLSDFASAAGSLSLLPILSDRHILLWVPTQRITWHNTC